MRHRSHPLGQRSRGRIASLGWPGWPVYLMPVDEVRAVDGAAWTGQGSGMGGDRDSGAPRGPARRGWRRAVRPLRRGAVILVLLLIIEYLVIPELVGASKNLNLLGRVNIGWMIAGLALEAASLFCYALLTRGLLPSEGRPGLSRLFRIDLAAAAVAHVVPAGTVGSAGIGYRLFTTEGVDGTDAGVMMATKGMGSTVVLNVLLWLSLVISIPLAGFHPIYVSVAITGAVALALVAALAFGLTRGEGRASRIVHAIGRRIPGLGGDRLERIFVQAGTSLIALARDRQVMTASLIWASLNWLLDAASLWCFVAAFGSFVNPAELFAAYGIANVLGVLPVTPGGLGVIDSTAPLLLVSFGITRSVATLGVLAWRLVNFWLPIPAGAAAYVSLKVPRGAGLGAARRAVAEMMTRGGRDEKNQARGTAADRDAAERASGTPGAPGPGRDPR
jgi:uncharacterized protein (TIRG00374 family)